MAKPTQRDLARSGPRGGNSGGVSSGGLGGSDRPDDRDRVQGHEGGSDPGTRPRTAGIFSGGAGGGNGRGGGGEPTKDEPGLVQQAEDALTRFDKEIRASVGADPFQESFRPDSRKPNDERPGAFGLLRPARPTEEEAIVPGDPDDLGERGRRRRTRDSVSSSPVLRRGLLGV